MIFKKDRARLLVGETKGFESNLLKELSSLMRVTQKETLSIARAHAEIILTMYSDGYSPQVTALYVRGIHGKSPEETWNFARDFALKYGKNTRIAARKSVPKPMECV